MLLEVNGKNEAISVHIATNVFMCCEAAADTFIHSGVFLFSDNNSDIHACTRVRVFACVIFVCVRLRVIACMHNDVCLQPVHACSERGHQR